MSVLENTTCKSEKVALGSLTILFMPEHEKAVTGSGLKFTHFLERFYERPIRSRTKDFWFVECL